MGCLISGKSATQRKPLPCWSNLSKTRALEDGILISTTDSGIRQYTYCIVVASICLSLLTACVAGAAWQKTPTLDMETLVLTQVGRQISMCPPDFGSNSLFVSTDESPVRFSLACGVGWGHVSDVQIQRYDSSPDAQGAFADICGSLPVQEFHGHPAIEWRCLARSYANCGPSSDVVQGMLHRNHCWQADRWLICAHAFDDTSHEDTVDPLTISEAVYQASVEQGLLPINK
jgi:hypothetical protein